MLSRFRPESHRLRLRFAVVCALALPITAAGASGCGDDAIEPATPLGDLLPGGGTSGETLDGQLTVFVEDAGELVQGAEIWIGHGDAAERVGTTSADGRLAFTHPKAVPGVAVTAVKGERAAMWSGLTTSSVTIPLPHDDAIETRTLSGTVDLQSLDDLALEPDEYVLAVVDFARSTDLGDASHALVQPSGADGVPASGCKVVDTSTPCAFALELPVGDAQLFAVVMVGTPAGDPDDVRDDAFRAAGLGFAAAAENASDIALTLSPGDALAVASIATEPAPGAEVTDVIGVPGITAKDQVLLYPRTFGRAESFSVPTDSTALGPISLWAVAEARSPETASPFEVSIALTRGIESSAAGTQSKLSTPAFLSPPELALDAGELTIDAGDATLALVELGASMDEANIAILILDGGSSVALPSEAGLSPAPPMRAVAWDVDFDPGDFAFDAVRRAATRRAETSSAQSAF